MAYNQTYMLLTNNGNREPETNDIRVFLGSYIHSENKNNPLQIVPNGVIGVQNGRIVFVDIEDNLADLKEKHCFSTDNIYVIGRGEFLMPGMVDAHIHAPQYPNAGLGLNLTLLDWLCRYTFPMEARFIDSTFARSCYKKVVQRTLCNGTTTANYFGTIHRQSCETLADVMEQYGQRGFVGKVCMDSNSPEYYVESTLESLKSAEDFLISMSRRKGNRVKPALAPRFAISCSEKLLTGLGALAKSYDVRIHTHLCESEDEISRTMAIFPQYKSYGEIYEKTGVMANKSTFAHCVHLSESEIEMLRSSKSGIAHCPTSNMCLQSGLCPVKKLIRSGLKVGLGTDVSGGYSPSMLEAMRHTILASKMLQMHNSSESHEPMSHKEVFYLGTLGGAEALSLDHSIGNFCVGKFFDALLVDIASPGSPIHLFPGEGLDDMVQKFIMLGDDRNIIQVFVEGKKVKTTW